MASRRLLVSLFSCVLCLDHVQQLAYLTSVVRRPGRPQPTKQIKENRDEQVSGDVALGPQRCKHILCLCVRVARKSLTAAVKADHLPRYCIHPFCILLLFELHLGSTRRLRTRQSRSCK